MNRMRDKLTAMKKSGHKILVSYFPIGDSYVADTVKWATDLYNWGTDVMEIGLPFEEPFLDGKTVADSMERARERTNLDKVFEEIKEVREANPDEIIQAMTYVENILKYGASNFAKLCSDCGVDAVLAANASPTEMHILDKAFKEYDIINLRFEPYNLSDENVQDLKENADGYIYLQAVDGKTGSSAEITDQVGKNVKLLEGEGIDTPKIPGFGISAPEHVRTYLSMGSDGVIIGSAIINNIIHGTCEEYIKSIRDALDGK